jgi:DNA (cytosine-5)-methyltransferase 1
MVREVKMSIKILNLYAGIGGNRKLWTGDIEVTAVELNPEIAKIYQDFFPNDKVIVADAHQYLLDHYKEFDFIWSSPPCPTHSRMRNLKNNCDETEKKYPDMKLYEEIIYLTHFFKGKYCVENVISYYEPLIKPQESNNHYFWCNFLIQNQKSECRGIRTKLIEEKEREREFKLPLDLTNTFKEKVLNNCVFPKLGLHIFECAFRVKQQTLIELERSK